MAGGVALGCGLFGAGITWMLMPEQFTYTATARVRIDPLTLPGVLPENRLGAVKDRLAQEQLAVSEPVLKAACARPGILELPSMAIQSDPVAWFQENLWVMSLPDSSLLEMRLSGRDGQEVCQLLDAVAQSYVEAACQADREFLSQLRLEREQQRRQARKALFQKMEQLRTGLVGLQVSQGKVLRLGATERIYWAIAMAGNQERVRSFQGLLAYLDRTSQTLQGAMEGSFQYRARGGVKQLPSSPKWMEQMREEAARGIAPPTSTPPEQLYAALHEVELEKADVQEELRVAQEEADDAARLLDSLVAASPKLKAQRDELLKLKGDMIQSEEPARALRAMLSGPPRIAMAAAPEAVKASAGTRDHRTPLSRGLIASLVGFATVFAVDSLLRRFAA